LFYRFVFLNSGDLGNIIAGVCLNYLLLLLLFFKFNSIDNNHSQNTRPWL